MCIFLASHWWDVFATTDFKLVYLSHRFHFASFLLFIVQLFKLFVVIQTAQQHSPISLCAPIPAPSCRLCSTLEQNAGSCLAFTSNYSKYLILRVWLKYKHLRNHATHTCIRCIYHRFTVYTHIAHSYFSLFQSRLRFPVNAYAVA